MELPTPKPAEEVAAVKARRQQRYRDNRQRVINHLKKRGLSNAAIAGIVGNIDIETGGTFDFQQRQTKSGDPRDPNIVPGGAYGLFQFDNPGKRAGHETWYKQYLEKTNKEDSAESQLDYFLDTINAGGDTQDPFYSFSKNVGAGNTGTIKGYFQSSEDPKTISDSITDRFLKPGKSHSDKRRASAEKTFAELQPTERADVDPENQNINQDAPIADVGEDVPSPENEPDKGFLETIKPFVPIYRHLNEGGMAKQMELFEDGGLKDEGGTVDPVSGNEVPPGSTQEEVRDDIPAQLSEGEFVIPADVVRYIGLGNLMQMRQEAKLGLKLMEEMGQMGNSEEATMPDDLPFDINDLDMEDEPEYNVGGFVPGTQQQQQFGISGFQQAAAPTTGVAQAPVQAASQQFVQPMVRPQQAAVPTMQQYKPADIPTFQQTIGQTPGQYDELRTYKNEAGMTMQIPFKNGQPIYPIPEGYKYVDPEATKTEDVTTTPTTPQTASVRDTSDRDERYAKEQEEKFGPGGGRLGVKGTIYGVSFDGPGGFKGTVGQVMGRTLGGKDLGPEITVRFQNEDDIFVLNGTEYNQLKTVIDEQGANSNAAQETLDKFKGGGKARANAEEVIKNLTMMSRGDGIMDKLGFGDDDPKIKEVIENYREHVEEQIAKGNINSKGQIINPFEAGGRGGTGRGTTLGARGRGEDSPSAARDYIISSARGKAEADARERAGRTPTRSGAAGKRMPKPGGSGRGEDSPSAARDYARSRAAEESRMQQRQTQTYQEDPSDPPTQTGTAQRDFSEPSPGTGSMDAARSYSMNRGPSDGYSGRSGGFSLARAEGGLVNKPKPKKTKKMKRGGLASKK